MTYADTDELIADKLPDVTADEDIATINRMNEAVSAMVDDHCRRKAGYFQPAAAAPELPDLPPAKRYRGNGGRILQIGKHVAGSVAVSGVANALWYESDKNGWLYRTTTTGGDAWTDGVSEFDSVWNSGWLYIVTARWGYEATPAPIVEAVKQIVEYWYNKGEGVIGEVSPSNFVIERNAPLSAKMLLNSYIKGEFEIE